jgi:hypothetical protein
MVLTRNFTRLMLLLVMLAPFAGCATTKRLTFDRAGADKSELERDENACLRSAIGIKTSGEILAPYCIDRDVFIQCMEARGYTVRSE